MGQAGRDTEAEPDRNVRAEPGSRLPEAGEPTPPSATNGRGHPAPARPSRRGQRIDGRWRLDALLAVDAQGELWRAGEARDRELEVRVRLYPVAPGDRAADERRAAYAERTHRSALLPHVLLEGRLDEATAFLLSEAPRGETLARRLREHGPPTRTLVLEPLARLLEELADLHRAGFAGLPWRADEVHLAELGYGLRLEVPELGLAGLVGRSVPREADDARAAILLACTLLAGCEVRDAESARRALDRRWLEAPVRRFLERCVAELDEPPSPVELRRRLAACNEALYRHGRTRRSRRAGTVGLVLALAAAGTWFAVGSGARSTDAGTAPASLAPGGPERVAPAVELEAARARIAELETALAEAQETQRETRAALEAAWLEGDAEGRLAKEERERSGRLLDEAQERARGLAAELGRERTRADELQAALTAREEAAAREAGDARAELDGLGEDLRTAEAERDALAVRLEASDAARRAAEERVAGLEGDLDGVRRELEAERSGKEAAAKRVEELTAELGDERRARGTAERAAEGLEGANAELAGEKASLAERLAEAETGLSKERSDLEQRLRATEAARDGAVERAETAEERAGALARELEQRGRELADAERRADRGEERSAALEQELATERQARRASEDGAGRAAAEREREAARAARAGAAAIDAVRALEGTLDALAAETDEDARFELAFEGLRLSRRAALHLAEADPALAAALAGVPARADEELGRVADAWRAGLERLWQGVERGPAAAEPGRVYALGLWFEDGRLARHLERFLAEVREASLAGGRWSLATLDAADTVLAWADLLAEDPLGRRGPGAELEALALRRRLVVQPLAELGAPPEGARFELGPAGPGARSVRLLARARGTEVVTWTEVDGDVERELRLERDGTRLRLVDEAGLVSELDVSRASSGPGAPGPILGNAAGLSFDREGLLSYPGPDGSLRVRAPEGSAQGSSGREARPAREEIGRSR